MVNKRDLDRKIDAAYYGYRDEEDGILVPVEQNLEAQGSVPLHTVTSINHVIK